MNGHSKHYSLAALRFLRDTSNDGTLPSAVEEHIADCPECMQTFLDMADERESYPVLDTSYDSIRPKEALRDADEDDGEATFVPPAKPVDTLPCWSDMDLQAQSMILSTDKIDKGLMLHVQRCAACREKLTGFFRRYKKELNRKKRLYRYLGLSRLFSHLMTKEWYRTRIVRAAFGAKDQK